MTTTDRKLLEQVDINQRNRDRARRQLQALKESGALVARSDFPIQGTREAVENQLAFLAATQAEAPGETVPFWQKWDWKSGFINPDRIKQGIARTLSKRGARYKPETYENVVQIMDYLFEPLDTPEEIEAYRKWALNPNASYSEMPPGAFSPELAIGMFGIPGGLQAIRDIWRDVKNGEVSLFTALDLLGAIPVAGVLVGLARSADDIGDAARRFARISEMDDLVIDAARPGQAIPESQRLLKLAKEDPKGFAEMNAYRVEQGYEPITIERLNFIEQNRIDREKPYDVVQAEAAERRRLAQEVDDEYDAMERAGMALEDVGFDRTKPGAWDTWGFIPQEVETTRVYRRTQEPAVLDPKSKLARTGNEGAEQERRLNYGDDFPPRLSFYTRDATVEPRFQNYDHEVAVDIPTEKLYDIDADPEGWRAAAGPGGEYTLFEKRVKDSPDYVGVISPSQNRVDVFDNVEEYVATRWNIADDTAVSAPEGSRAFWLEKLASEAKRLDSQPGWVRQQAFDDLAERYGLPDEWIERAEGDYLRDRYNMPDVESAQHVEDGLKQATREIVDVELETVNGEQFRSASILEDGRTIGQLRYSLFDDKALLNWIGVDESRRRTGAARELFEAVRDNSIGGRRLFTNDQTDDGMAFLRGVGAEIEENLGTLPAVRVGPMGSPEPSLGAHFASQAQRAKISIRSSSKATGADVVANHNSPVGGAGGSSTRYSDAQNMGELEEGYVGALGDKESVSAVISKDEFTPEAVDAYIAEAQELLGSEEGLAIGTWENPETGMIELDVSKVFEDRDDAIRYAARHGHEAVWDLANEADLATREHTGLERWLRPEERLLYLDADGFPQGELVKMWGQAPTARELASGAAAGAAARGWYRASSAALVDVFGEDAPRFAAMLAALSPQTSVEQNLKGTLLFWNRWNEAGRPLERGQLQELLSSIAPTYEGQAATFEAAVVLTDQSTLNNLQRAASSPDPIVDYLSGAKVDSFMNNLLQDVDRVTMDTWGTKYLGMNPDRLNSRNITLDALKTPEYRAYREVRADALRLEPGQRRPATPGEIAKGKTDGKLLHQGQADQAGGIGVASRGYALGGALHREAAEELSNITGMKWTPEEVQETNWSLFKSVIDKDPDNPDNWQQLLREIENEEIAKAASFDQLLQEPGYRGLLAEGGLPEPQLRPELRGAEVPEGTVRQGDVESLMDRAIRHKRKEYDIPSLLLPLGGGSLLGAHFLRQQEEEKRGRGLLE